MELKCVKLTNMLNLFVKISVSKSNTLRLNHTNFNVNMFLKAYYTNNFNTQQFML